MSEYATENYLEVVAEVYAGMRAGRRFSDRVMRLYGQVGGPSVEPMEQS